MVNKLSNTIKMEVDVRLLARIFIFFLLEVVLLCASGIGLFYFEELKILFLFLHASISGIIIYFLFRAYLTKKKIILYGTVFLFIHIGIVSSTQMEVWLVENSLRKMDIDHDLIFSSSEQDSVQQKLFQRSINDIGENLIFVTGIIYAIICAGVFAGIVECKDLIMKKHLNK